MHGKKNASVESKRMRKSERSIKKGHSNYNSRSGGANLTSQISSNKMSKGRSKKGAGGGCQRRSSDGGEGREKALLREMGEGVEEGGWD